MLKCKDGYHCNVDNEGYSCCNERGGRAKCPKNWPNMCVEKACADKRDHCCASEGVCEERHGGLLPCGGKK